MNIGCIKYFKVFQIVCSSGARMKSVNGAVLWVARGGEIWLF